MHKTINCIRSYMPNYISSSENALFFKISSHFQHLKQRKLMTYNLIDAAAAGVPYPLIHLLTVLKLHWLDQQASSLSDLKYFKDKTGTFSVFIETIKCKPVLKRDGQKIENQNGHCRSELVLHLQNSQSLHHKPLFISQLTGFPDCLPSLQISFTAGKSY